MRTLWIMLEKWMSFYKHARQYLTGTLLERVKRAIPPWLCFYLEKVKPEAENWTSNLCKKRKPLLALTSICKQQCHLTQDKATSFGSTTLFLLNLLWTPREEIMIDWRFGAMIFCPKKKMRRPSFPWKMNFCSSHFPYLCWKSEKKLEKYMMHPS